MLPPSPLKNIQQGAGCTFHSSFDIVIRIYYQYPPIIKGRPIIPMTEVMKKANPRISATIFTIFLFTKHHFPYCVIKVLYQISSSFGYTIHYKNLGCKLSPSYFPMAILPKFFYFHTGIQKLIVLCQFGK